MNREDLDIPSYFLTIGKLAETMNVKVTWIRNQILRNNIPYMKFGNQIRFDPKEICQWIESTRMGRSEGRKNA